MYRDKIGQGLLFQSINFFTMFKYFELLEKVIISNDTYLIININTWNVDYFSIFKLWADCYFWTSTDL